MILLTNILRPHWQSPLAVPIDIYEKNFDDKLAYYISTKELYDIVLFLLKTIRSLIINLICCINIEERKKCEEANKERKFIPPLNTYPIDEGLKF